MDEAKKKLETDGWFRLYRMPEWGEFIVCGADPSEGGDYCCAIWKSKTRGDTVMAFHAKVESSQFGYEIVKGCRFIKEKTGIFPVVAVERNTGMATISRLVDLNYPELWRMVKFDTDYQETEENKIGWHTNMRTRPLMLDELAQSIRQRENIIYDAEELEEFMSFIRNPKTGRPEADKKSHDDWVMAEAIAWQLVQTVSVPITDYDLPPDDLFNNGFY